ncbi:TetR/AcrR family transcriptional regulator [Humibacter ginsengiterrae]
MSTSGARGPYAKTAATRQRILEACIEAFAESGFHGTTMKDIAVRAGISYTGLLHHFPKKEDLLQAVLDYRADRDHEFLDSIGALDWETDPLGVFRGMLAVIHDNVHRPGLLELHTVVSGEAASPEHPAHAHYIEHYRNLREFYRLAYESLARLGLLHSDSSPEALATQTIALINGLQAQWLFDRTSVDMERDFRAFLNTVIPGFDVLAARQSPEPQATTA